jgi:hypothetical protein
MQFKMAAGTCARYGCGRQKIMAKILLWDSTNMVVEVWYKHVLFPILKQLSMVLCFAVNFRL